MYKRIAIIAGLISIPFLTGCQSHKPLTTYHETYYQTQLQSASHWDLIAKKYVESNKKALPKSVELKIESSNEFGDIYRKILEVELANQGISTVGDSNAVIKISTVVVPHHNDLFNVTNGFARLGYVVNHLFTGNSMNGYRNEFVIVHELIVDNEVKSGDVEVTYVSRHDLRNYQNANNSSLPIK